jgi:hypothetical protein
MAVRMLSIFAARNSEDDESGFWDWVRQNLPQPDHTQDDLVRFCNAANQRLGTIAPGLCFEAGTCDEAGLNIIISADGIRDHFPDVKRLVAAAGAIDGCRVIAFRQPAAFCDLNYGGKTFRPSDVWFEAYTIDGEIGLNLHVSGLDPANPAIEGGAAFIFLDAVLGEYDVGTKIGPIDFFPLADEPASQGLRPILELRGVVDQMLPGRAH